MAYKVLLIGIDPREVDLSDPFFPADLTHEKISESINQSLAEMKRRGWEPAFCGLHLVSAEADAKAALVEKWDCIVIGAGMRVPPKNLELFETVVNTIARYAAGTPIAFNTGPLDSADAAARRLGKTNGPYHFDPDFIPA
ncbi:hypothetical protein AB9E14_27920 [Rhizobium leguminosarum]|uniref:hypothetical protein n=1 Tax=Rhizobium leguminosarum TaxID=384 RepID=UPI0004BB0667|nr:hypothetical protein [Rhizobium leguminosarum]QIO76233.1 hypothetical protein HA459_30015 [Rhizobium leguminosarum bv. trifolii]QIO83251.1 hypothetical protein HA460_30050 [Rhizobium leguminosarum bv. trifolii]TAU16496.1 hypothetical protein ELI50_27230 [Rhizobium leguminosarum]TAU34809.1 hypothetical protein ELI51_32955 [Rhizobium leguminosarum]TAX44013.1 hypothetical protein ELH99_31630 [Rhizobium leguminosarum]